MDKQAFTVNEFCHQYSISRSLFYKLQRQGRGPEITKINNKTLIMCDAIRRWREVVSAA
jgi:hypothetical protein